MDMRNLLEKLMKFAGEPGQKPGDQVRGYEKAKTGTKKHPFAGRLVGAAESQGSILKDLKKRPKTKAEELAEEYEAFLQALDEENIGVNPKRPNRKGSRHPRGHEPQPRYNYTKKVDEYGADNPPQTSSTMTKPTTGQLSQTQTQQDTQKTTGTQPNNKQPTPQEVAAQQTALKNLRAAAGISASDKQVADALEKFSQGQADATVAKTLEPIADKLAQSVKNPNPQTTAALKNFMSSVVKK